MARFLSAEWVAALDERLSALALPGRSDATLTLEYVVVGTPNGERAYTIVLGPEPAARAGRVDAPDVSFTTDYETAARIARGETAAQAAFMTGRLRVHGDVTRLVAFAPTRSKSRSLNCERTPRTSSEVHECPSSPRSRPTHRCQPAGGKYLLLR